MRGIEPVHAADAAGAQPLQAAPMNQRITGIAVSRGIAIGRAMVLGREVLQVKHYLVLPEQIEPELQRLRRGFTLAMTELRRMQQRIEGDAASAELYALLDVHAMLLEDEALREGANATVRERRYNAEWALLHQLGALAREFDAMDDSYLRERKADLEQLVGWVVQCMRVPVSSDGAVAAPPPGPLGQALSCLQGQGAQGADGAGGDGALAQPFIIVAHDLGPADMLHFKQDTFAGFVADTGGQTSHTAIVARSMDIPAVVGTRQASQQIQQDDTLIVYADAGLVIVNPDEQTLQAYRLLKEDLAQIRERQQKLLHTPAVTRDGRSIELLANVELPTDCAAALRSGAVGVGLFRSEFLFMGRHGALPDEQEQYGAYRDAVLAMEGLPVTIRTVDIGADKTLDGHAVSRHSEEHSALGLRAIRWSLSSPAMFCTQLRALLRAAVHGPLSILFPMLAQLKEVRQTLQMLEVARQELRDAGVAFGPVRVGAMIEVPAAALMIEQFLQHFDFVSIGTNDLTQYTLAVDRADESVAHLFDATHPAVLRLIAGVINAGRKRGKPVCLCGEIAGDPQVTDLLLGLGLQSFSMHPAQLLAVKERVLAADTQALAQWARDVLGAEDPQTLLQEHREEAQAAVLAPAA